MLSRILLVISLLVIGGRELQAQERVPLPPPDPVQPGPVSGQPPSGPLQPPSSGIQFPPLGPTQPGGQYPAYPPPGTYPPGAYPPGAYPPGAYPPPGVYPPGIYPPPGTLPPSGLYPPPGVYPPPGIYPPPPPPLFRGDSATNPGFWIGTEALIWWTKNQPLSVPLLTTGPASAGMNAGGLGVPGTVSLNQSLNYDVQGGFRLFAGGWFDPAHTWGLEGSIFVLGQSCASFGVSDRSGTGATIINEPLGGSPPFTTLVSYPGLESGNATVSTTTQLWGLDLNALYNLYRGANWNVTLLAGFRYLRLDEELDIVANSNLFTTTTYTDNFGNVLATAPPGSSVTVVDQFGAHNDFYGGQIGIRGDYNWNRWSFSGTGLLAIGATHESVWVNGTTTVYPVNGQATPLAGGNYATLQIGRYTQDRFAVAPELKLSVGYQFTPTLRGTLGYDLLFLSDVLRPGNQIDNTFDGMNHPNIPFKSSTFWSQGLNLNLEFTF